MKATKIYDVRISTDLYAALVNADHTGLTDEESALLNDWETDIIDEVKRLGGHSAVYSAPEEITHIAKCDVTGLAACVYDVEVVMLKESHTPESKNHEASTSR